MTDTYVVVAQVGGFTAKDADADNRKDKLDHLKAAPGLDLVASLIRDDGTAELCFAWEPDPVVNRGVPRIEEVEDPATTWMAGRRHADHVKSAVQGASLALLNPVSIEMRSIDKSVTTRKAASTKSSGSR